MRRPSTSICLLGEMIVTLDDVVCLLHIWIKGKMMNGLLGAFVTIPCLKTIYEEHPNLATQLENVAEIKKKDQNEIISRDSGNTK